ncbi:MAG: DNA translocase FtsK 4TM domain-containing protein [Cyclobacteriaceae bacterium]|nr:DNA translocase FtsK 4TM domain-containing protein [Cyclobacteriaceae bacterium]
MNKNTYKGNTYKTQKAEKPERKKLSFGIGFLKDRRLHLSFGVFLFAASIFLAVSFVSYLFSGKADQSILEVFTFGNIAESGQEIKNWFGYLGAVSSHYFIYKWFGISAFFIPPLMFLIANQIVFRRKLLSLGSYLQFMIFFSFWLSLLFGYITYQADNPGHISYIAGGMGYELAIIFNGFLGWGTYVFLLVSFLVFIIFFFNITSFGTFALPPVLSNIKTTSNPETEAQEEEVNQPALDPLPLNIKTDNTEGWVVNGLVNKNNLAKDPGIEITGAVQPVDVVKGADDVADEAESENPLENLPPYDPTLDLGSFKFPEVSLLSHSDQQHVQVTKEELEQNKDKIVETLINFKIGISSLKATIGPTVTLYEIIPDAGVKISRIKNLEDDIALSLSALGIRIIAPMPGKGTIGIEVPNKNREMVSARSVFASDKFQNSTFDLPVILGKTISNEVYLADLSKMPHLLMAGATGQGKSVGLNILIASLLYKLHPSQLKFVMVDPKKVELTLYNIIERHYLATLPDSEEAIITDNKKVIYTLNSLCIEMDNRLGLLKAGGCRNLKEYNTKFVRRQLNPEKGHRFMPYIVLIIDELADLMVTSGKEIETPIARLAAVSRATGIHLVLATQRPSVNVITGIIKANFPARLSFRVISKIDSRTILDSGGAEQLVGLGDMLYSHGSDLVRLQGPFIDTDEVKRICEFIGGQRGYESAYMLPEFEGESSESQSTVDLGDRDDMFDEAARLIVRHQQGSTSLIQRKLKLGYNRAGRLIDQLEAARIVGPFEGSKAREVLVQDEYVLEQLLNELNDKKTNRE